MLQLCFNSKQTKWKRIVWFQRPVIWHDLTINVSIESILWKWEMPHWHRPAKWKQHNWSIRLQSARWFDEMQTRNMNREKDAGCCPDMAGVSVPLRSQANAKMTATRKTSCSTVQRREEFRSSLSVQRNYTSYTRDSRRHHDLKLVFLWPEVHIKRQRPTAMRNAFTIVCNFPFGCN